VEFTALILALARHWTACAKSLTAGASAPVPDQVRGTATLAPAVRLIAPADARSAGARISAVSSTPHVYVDADACPVKAETVKVAERHGLPVVFVANAWLTVPRGPRVRVQVVPGAFDAADDWIAGQVQKDDVVITTDIPLASRCLKQGARVLKPTGQRYTDDNIGNALATRELMSELRAYGVGGGPPPFGPKDRSRFLEVLENVLREAKHARATTPHGS
jgi:hypothetical protein